MKKTNASHVILTAALATAAVLGLAGCGAGGQSSDDAAKNFAVALKEQNVPALCNLAAIGGQPVAGNKSRAALCKEVLAPKIMVGMKSNSALKTPKVTMKENGDNATATVAGLPSALTLKKIDGNWLIVIA